MDLKQHIKRWIDRVAARLDVSEEPEYLERYLRMTRSALYCSYNFKYKHPPHIHHSCLKENHRLHTSLKSHSLIHVVAMKTLASVYSPPMPNDVHHQQDDHDGE